MATQRRPKGSYTRPTSDFFIDRAATVGGWYSPTAVLEPVLDLYNNAQDGSNLHVYRVWVGNDAASIYGMTQIKGHGANLMQAAVPVVTGAPRLPGELYYDGITPSYTYIGVPKDQPISDAFFMDNEAGSQDAWQAAGPICVIQPGYALRVYPVISKSNAAGGFIAATFYYIALRDIG